MENENTCNIRLNQQGPENDLSFTQLNKSVSFFF